MRSSKLTRAWRHRLQSVHAVDPTGWLTRLTDNRRSATFEELRARQREVDSLVERALGAEEAGKLGTAKIYFQMAARRASGEQKRKLLKHLIEIGD